MSAMNEAPSAAARTAEWKPPALADYNAMHPGWSHRFADKNSGNRRGDRLQYWLNQGWEVAPYGNEGMKANRSTGASSQDHGVHYRGLILLRAPLAVAEARNRHYREKHQRILGAANRMRELAEASQSANREAKRKLTSAFAEARVQKGGDVLEDSRADTERRLRDVDPSALTELKDRLARMEEEQRELREENARMKRVAAERAARPSDRKRRSFPVS
jgi:hypothetical protein